MGMSLTLRAVCGKLRLFGVGFCGRIAQLGERFPYKEEVTGSSPVSPTR
jgi:hypothetical protein